ncbi:MAG TPA: 30S ribosomal protein S12 methylthiotransferase RimO [Candidatus Anaerobutyricum faecale]|uniref:30S ribosomal protein S12 methylthiotransferase RimO n=1 Tax=Eubacterium sp. An11 TaxID=1965542 RepID=UPI000B3A6D6E|nr:30S ribosomal protein S12 methylthiotransferase RimO [Eubacterium sp. An11]OUQ70135.1 30S ribosomal protein S12 methylthiotransferase RimO [Eubacterium sp. An11]HJC31456.1 30S ribosomal protein S12 methylthiotransferase RimO [Candidatus Anaerobutyricum faecale]
MKNVLMISLGCDKNLVDSEKMLGLLAEGGYTIVEEEAEADAIVINTCCFIHDAKEESIETILEMASWKEKGRLKALVITGCLAQRYKDEIAKELPEVDAVIGISGYTEIVPVLDALLKEAQTEEEHPLVCCPSIDLLTPSLSDKRMVTTGSYTAYLKIAEGCNKRCTYCVIPYIRGRYRSFPMEDLLDEAGRLVEGGAKELILIAQETTVYGMDLYGKKMLPELLHRLCGLEGLDWIRILYCYPEEITDELIQVMKEEEKICHYLDIPIQHSEDSILKRMGRKTDRAELTELIGKLRREIPDIILRTTLITGFPGETEEEFERMKDFVEQMRFDRLGVFTYSPEEGTKAADMEGQIDEECKEARRDAVMELQQQISAEKAASMVGKEMSVLIEGYLYEEDIYVGRTYMDAPKVDGNVFVRSEEEMISGDIVPVRITGASEYDLMGDVIYEDEFTE